MTSLMQFDSLAANRPNNPTVNKEADTISTDDKKWKIIVIDDDKYVHRITHHVLNNFQYNNCGVEIFDGYSGEDAINLITEHPDTAVLLLDVVMETDDAGLKVVKHIRETLKNRYLRIILRTGQSSKAPEKEIIEKLSINDYQDKSELTPEKLQTALTSALRSYEDIKYIEHLAQSNEALEKAVLERTQQLAEINHDLQKNKAYLAQAQEITNIGSWNLELETDAINCSEQIYRLLGLPNSNKKIQTLNQLLEFIPENERPWVQQIIQDGKKNGAYRIEHHLNVHGELRYINQQGKLIFDEQTQKQQLMCVIHDITEYRKTEKELLKLANAIEEISDAVMIVDDIGTIEYVNKAFCKMSGYSKEELIGALDTLKAKADQHTFYKRLKHAFQSQETSKSVSINRRKDGSRYYEERTITPLNDESDNMTHYLLSCRDVTKSIEAKEKLQHQAQHDPLTGLPNRSLFYDRIEQKIARAPWHNRLVALIFIDLDGFKEINDELGHDIGDKLLQNIANRLLQCVRDGDTTARLGGDEFAVILDDIAQKRDVEKIAQKMLILLNEPLSIDGHDITIGVSMGISLCPDDGNDSKRLLKKADIAMYQVKANNKNDFQFYTEKN